jgi:S1-C subfamily serine protease
MRNRDIRRARSNLQITFAATLAVLLTSGCADKAESDKQVGKAEAATTKVTYLYPFRSGESDITKDQWGFIDENGVQQIQPQFSMAGYFSDGLAAIRIGDARAGGKVGFVDSNGKIVINPIYDECSAFKNGKAICIRDGAVITGGALALCSEMDCIYNDGNAVVIDVSGNEVASFDRKRFDLSVRQGPSSLGDGLLAVGFMKDESGTSLLPSNAKKHGFMKLSGEPAFVERFDWVRAFSEGLAIVHEGWNKEFRGGKTGFIDKSGKLVIPMQYSSARNFNEGMAAVAVGGISVFGLAKGAKWGFIDKGGKLVISLQFDGAGDFSDGLAPVRVGDKWGFIDRSGKFVVNPTIPSFQSDEVIESYHGPLACIVDCGSRPIYIDRRGEVVSYKSRSAQDKQQILSKKGSGFYVSGKGHIVTNAHVAADCKTLKVIAPEEATAEVIAIDQANDLALLKTSISPKQHASITTSQAKLGQDVIAFGFPLAGVLSSSGNITTGTVSSLAGLGDNSNHLQISAPIQQGNSGGPIFDRKGSVMGIVLQKLDVARVAKATGDIPQNVNFAIKADVITRFMIAHDIQPTTPSIFNVFEKSSEELALHAKAVSVAVECSK